MREVLQNPIAASTVVLSALVSASQVIPTPDGDQTPPHQRSNVTPEDITHNVQEKVRSFLAKALGNLETPFQSLPADLLPNGSLDRGPAFGGDTGCETTKFDHSKTLTYLDI
jgi:hypothetical protein